MSLLRINDEAPDFAAENLRFQVALSFPGTKRDYVEALANRLKKSLPKNQVFYDRDFQAHLARPDLDVLLLKIYRARSSLVVVFLAKDYATSDWCGLEWRAIRDMIKKKSGKQVMFVRFDGRRYRWNVSIDGYLDATVFTPEQIATYILERVNDNA